MEQILNLDIIEEQAMLFEDSAKFNIDSKQFIELFMHSKIAEGLDSSYSRYYWTGREYMMEKFCLEYKAKFIKDPIIYSRDVLFWIGYMYRYWHYYTGEKAGEIYELADAKRMKNVYPGYHTLSCEEAIDRLKGISKN